MRALLAAVAGLAIAGTFGVSGAKASDAATGEGALISASCSGCHTQGDMDTSIPNLSSYTSDQIAALLTQFQTDDPDNPVTLMNRIARGYSADEIKTIADYLGKAEE